MLQRFLDDPTVFPGRVSDGGQIAVTDRQSAYATRDLFKSANGALEASQAAVRVEPGGELDLGQLGGVDTGNGPLFLDNLHRIKPVFKKGSLGPEAEGSQPVEGEGGPERASKLARYKKDLSTSALKIFEVETALVQAWRAAEKQASGLLGFTADSPGYVVHRDFTQNVVTLIKETMGPMWLGHSTARPVLNPSPPSALTLQQYRTLFSALYQDYSSKLENDMAPELSMLDLWMVLPNDCKRAAQMLTGMSAAELSTRRADPAIGANYYTALGTTYGWGTHYATVIMKDGGDNLTYETAADFEAPIESGMSLGFFELYGTKKATQSFDYVVRDKQRKLIERVSGKEWREVNDPKAREEILSKVAEDLGVLSARQEEIVKGQGDAGRS